MKRTVIITILVVILTSVGLISFVKITSKSNPEEFNIAEAKQGDFEIVVTGDGELIPEHSVDIQGPNIVQNRNFRVSLIKIFDLVPEGTLVSKGDYIGSLDRTNFNNSLKDEQDVLKRLKSDLEMKLYDTALVLSTIRDDMKDQAYASEEASINLEISKYEPPAVQRKAEMEVEKSRRFLHYKQQLYLLKRSQAVSQIRNLKRDFDRQQKKVNDLEDVLSNFTIKAPSSGMVMYKKDMLGNKIKTGSYMDPFNSVIATLPVMSTMLSKIYVSELEVNKLKIGQPVRVTIDAFQGKNLAGEVASVANMGEKLKNSDSKVFEVLIRMKGSDPSLRPSMTTGNTILLNNYSNVVFIPAECVQAGSDSIPYVLTKDGRKQIVVLGQANDKSIIIEKGISPGTVLWLSQPSGRKKFVLSGTELIPEITQRARLARNNNLPFRKKDEILTQNTLQPDRKSKEMPEGSAN